MVAVKAHQANHFIKNPDPHLNCFLFYGSDVGLVSERAAAMAKKIAAQDDPAGEILRLDDTDLEDDSERLAIELRTLPMFGGRKIIRTTLGRRVTGALITELVSDGDLAGVLIIEAGNLKPSDKLRKSCEGSKTAAAIACFPDAAKDLKSVIDDVLSSSGQSIDTDAKSLLVSRLGADRAMSRGEIEKLSLYVGDRKKITSEDIDAIVGDASELAFDRVISAAFAGRSESAVNEYSRSVASGESPQVLILMAGRYMHRLHRIRCETDSGKPLDAALRALRPPLHFKQKDAFSAQLRGWSRPKLDRGLAMIASAAQAARRSNQIETLIAERLLINLSHLANRR